MLILFSYPSKGRVVEYQHLTLVIKQAVLLGSGVASFLPGWFVTNDNRPHLSVPCRVLDMPG
jgi:hypothetical protein